MEECGRNDGMHRKEMNIVTLLNKWGGVKTFTISLPIYKAFQQCSQDYNPLHTDEEFARSKGFQSRVMYGNILNAFVSNVVGEALPVKDVIIHSQDIQYKNPVYLNDKLEMETTVEDIHESVNTVILKFKFTNASGVIVAKGHIQIGILK